MELNDILALAKAGYTKDEIEQMVPGTTPVTDSEPVQMAMDIPAPNAEPVKSQTAEPVAPAVAEPKAEPEPEPKPQEPTLNDLMLSIAKLTSAVQANAIAQSVIPGGAVNPPKAEDMLAEIIRPTYKERENA